jgi:hypothetical protein
MSSGEAVAGVVGFKGEDTLIGECTGSLQTRDCDNDRDLLLNGGGVCLAAT